MSGDYTNFSRFLIALAYIHNMGMSMFTTSLYLALHYPSALISYMLSSSLSFPPISFLVYTEVCKRPWRLIFITLVLFKQFVFKHLYDFVDHSLKNFFLSCRVSSGWVGCVPLWTTVFQIRSFFIVFDKTMAPYTRYGTLQKGL